MAPPSYVAAVCAIGSCMEAGYSTHTMAPSSYVGAVCAIGSCMEAG